MLDVASRVEGLRHSYERLDTRITAALARAGVPVLRLGLGLLSGRFLRATLFLLALQMAGTLTPLVLFPGEAFARFPIAPTLEGQYIIKNVVLIGAAMAVGATVRGGRLVVERETSSVSLGRSAVDTVRGQPVGPPR